MNPFRKIYRKASKIIYKKSINYKAISRLNNFGIEPAKLLADSISKTLKNKFSTEDYAWINRIELLRGKLAGSKDTLEIIDYGAGSPNLNLTQDEMYRGRRVESKVCEVCRSASKSPMWCRLLFSLVREFKPDLCLELGTSIGISACYLGSALGINKKGKIITLEGSDSLASLADANFKSLGINRVELVKGRFNDTLSQILNHQKSIDFAFIDGHHDEQATFEYFLQILPFLTDDGLMVFDDISWSKGMERAWRKITAHEDIKISIDIFDVGICLKKSNCKDKTYLKMAID